MIKLPSATVMIYFCWHLIHSSNTQSYCNVNSTEPVELPIAALFPKSGWWPGGEALYVAANMALDDVNARTDILPGYKLQMVWNNTEVRHKPKPYIINLKRIYLSFLQWMEFFFK